jgi:integrase/recombinase XerD
MYIQELIRKAGMRKGLSLRTIKVYGHCVRLFFNKCKKDPKKVKKRDVLDFLDKLIDKNSAGSTLNVYINALNFFYREILHKGLMNGIRFSKIPKRLPTVLTKDETRKLISVISNEKHKLIVKIMYSAGLRVSELVKLKVKDLGAA